LAEKKKILAYLIVKKKGEEATRFPLHSETTVTIGRSRKNNLCLLDAGASRKHALIEIGYYKFTIKDGGSRNGLLVNGEKCREAKLEHDDIVQVGAYVLTFKHIGTEVKQEMRKVKTLNRYQAKQNILSRLFGDSFDGPEPPTKQIAVNKLDEAFTEAVAQKSAVLQDLEHSADVYPLDREKTLLGPKGIPFIAEKGKGKCGIKWNGESHVLLVSADNTINIKVNGKPIKRRKALKVEDRIRIGESRFVYRLDEKFRKKLY
jgi:pSer/pThr/pTyr-binding forkhead associated (FHA) protein